MPWPFWWTNSGAQRKKWRTISVGPRPLFEKRLTQIISAILVEMSYHMPYHQSQNLYKHEPPRPFCSSYKVKDSGRQESMWSHASDSLQETFAAFARCFPALYAQQNKLVSPSFLGCYWLDPSPQKRLVYRLYRFHVSIVWWVKEERLRRCGWVPRGGQRAEQKGTTVFSGRNPSQDGEGKYI